MDCERRLLHFLALTRAAASGQLGEVAGLGTKRLRTVLAALQRAGRIAPAARVRLNPTGRPQTVWRLTARGARQAGVYFAHPANNAGLVAALLRAHFRLRYPDGDWPLFFADQVAAFEAQGQRWPWQEKLAPSVQARTGQSGPHGPQRVGALVRLAENSVHVGLPLANEATALRWLARPERRLAWTQAPGYRLTLVVPEAARSAIAPLLAGRPDLNDPFFRQAKTYREWRAFLPALTPAEQRYRRYIEALLARIERQGAQHSPERWPLLPRSFPAQPVEAEVLELTLARLRALPPGCVTER